MSKQIFEQDISVNIYDRSMSPVREGCCYCHCLFTFVLSPNHSYQMPQRAQINKYFNIYEKDISKENI